MTVFRFEALRPDGSLIRGRIEAMGRPGAVEQLARRGLTPVDVRPRGARRPRPPADHLAVLFRALSSLVDAGLPLDGALAISGQDGPLADFVAGVRTRLAQGQSFAVALDHGGDLPPVVSALVRSGERFGLAFALEQAAQQLERDSRTHQEMRAALSYPALLGVVGVASVGLLVTTILPRFVALLQDVGATVPPLARFAVWAGHAVTAGWAPVLAGMLVAGLALRRARTSHTVHALYLRLPVIGAIRERFATARTARVLGALLGVRVPTLEALRIAGEASGDRELAGRVERAGARVRTGATLSAALGHEHAMTFTALQLLAAGERAGRAPDMLGRAADMAEDDGRRRLQAALRLVEPVMILGMGALVALAAVTLLQAVYGIRLT